MLEETDTYSSSWHAVYFTQWLDVMAADWANNGTDINQV